MRLLSSRKPRSLRKSQRRRTMTAPNDAYCASGSIIGNDEAGSSILPRGTTTNTTDCADLATLEVCPDRRIMRHSPEHMENIVSPEELRERFNYDPETGKITYKKRVSTRTPVGSEAGSIDGQGYRLISLRTTKRSAHRIAFDLMGVHIPDGMKVDHINGKRDDNRWSNLRLVTQGQNCRNARLNINNKSGVSGVRWNRQNRRWVAKIRFRGKRYHLGSFKRKEDAVAARKDAEQKYGFHPNHGNPSPLESQ